MFVGRRARKVIIILTGAVLGLFVLLLACPLWFPWLLKPLARHFGATYSRYERQGYFRFMVSDVNYQRGRAHFTAQRLEALVPTVWCWRLLSGTNSSSPVFVSASAWRYETLPTTNQVARSLSGRNYTSELKKWSRWLPIVTLTNGTLKLPAASVEFPAATWDHGALRGALLYSPQNGAASSFRATFAAHPAGPDVYQTEINSPYAHLFAQAHIFTTLSGVRIQSTNSWWGNPFELGVRFEPGSGLPAVADLSAPQVRLPPEASRLRHYGDLTGSVKGDWQNGQFTLDVDAQAQPLPVSTNFPPLSLSLHARGNTNSAVVERAILVAPWLNAQLSRGFEVHFSGKLLREPAYLTVSGDLERQPWFPVRGKLAGDAEFTPSWGKFPAVDFHVSGAQLGYHDFQTRTVNFEGSMEWPDVQFSRAEATLDDGTTIRASGKVNLADRNVSAGTFQLVGPWLKRWLPAGYGFETMESSGTAAGRLPMLNHTGTVNVTRVTSPYVRPLDIKADWSGTGTSLTNAVLTATAGSSELSVQAAGEASATNARVSLLGCSLLNTNESVFTLVTPAQLEFTRGAQSGRWHWQVSPFRFEGRGGTIAAETSLSWPDHGNFNVNLHQFSGALIDNFLKTNLPAFSLKDFAVNGGWSNGPAHFQVALDSTVPELAFRGFPAPLRLSLEAAGNADGLAISNLALTSQTSAVLVVKGFLPVALYPGTVTNLLRIQPDKTLSVHAETTPAGFPWGEVANVSGVRLVDPQLTADASGTWNQPSARINLRARRIELTRHTNTVPDLRNLDLQFDVDPNEARVVTGEVLLQGQRVTLEGALPLGPQVWAGLRHKELPDWTRARAHLQVQEADLAAFEPMFRELLVPQGYVSLDLLLLPGGNLEGQAEVAHARTRPLGEMGPIRDIGINVRLRDRYLTLEGASARIGGATLTLSGQAELTGTNWLKGQWPPFELAVRGIGVPLARNPELVLRSDLLLGITKTNGAPPLVTGTANLRDSFYLSDLQKLIPGQIEAPSRRPPYFSIQERWLADWRLAVDLQGPRFLKVRSPLFNGEISVNGKLQGTLKDPIALGDLKIDSGAVRFPFASIPVQQGIITLSSQDPYHPQLSVLGASKQFGYDIRMDITGSVDSPVIQFSSTPPLSSEQILLMVTAGELPQGTYSLTTQQRAQTMALFLGRDILSKLGVGDQAEQRLTVHSGEEISEQGRPTYNVEYKLTDRWSLTGEYDRFGDFNAGFRWRVFSR